MKISEEQRQANAKAASDIIDDLGGTNAAARRLGGAKQNTVSSWRKRGFPAGALDGEPKLLRRYNRARLASL